MELDGEHLHAVERVIVSPGAGVFIPVAPSRSGEPVEVGTTVGFVEANGSTTPVRSAFRGRLVALDVSPGQRLTRHQRVGWLRAS
jgi:[acyl-carrier-protein] S-malonyltransferase